MHRPIALITFTFGLGAAQVTGGPSLKLSLYAVTTQDGQDVLTPTATALPGQRLRQVATITTKTSYPKTFSVRVPVPQNTTYAGQLRVPTGATVTYSVDGAAYSPKPTRTVTEGGRTRTEPIPEREYRAVKVTFTNAAPTALNVAYDIRLN